MNKKLLLLASGVGALSGLAVTYTINKKNNKDHFSTFENAGIPDQSSNKSDDQLENSKMVSEGSQFGVQYYNELKAERKNVK